jgi:single-strand DNA-binding protein
MNINTVHMTGNLTDDPELRYTPSGKPVVSASIANNEHYTDAQGEEKKWGGTDIADRRECS